MARGVPFFITGYNSGVSTSITDLAEHVAGGALYAFPAAATAMEVVSASANDAAAGTGARQVQVVGLDANYNPQSETVILNGTTPVATAKSYLRINDFHVLAVGSGGVSAGNITLRDAGAGTTRSRITAGFQRALQGIFTVPAGFRADILYPEWGVDTAKAARALVYANVDPDEMSPLPVGVFVELIHRIMSGPVAPNLAETPMVLPPKTDMRLSALTLAATAAVSGKIGIVLHRVQ
jgi:hypothetical protein